MSMTSQQAARNVYCDACGQGFTPDVVETPTQDGGARQTFDCPACGETFLVCTISARGLELRPMLREAMETAAAIRAEFQAEVTSYGE